jgi:eukaryotic-like serine/threonine-protein kinase
MCQHERISVCLFHVPSLGSLDRDYNGAHRWQLGPYEIQSPLGSGGMGEVYRARDSRLDRIVAIKILPSHLSEDAAARQRFDREARAISSLSHPNICHLYDVGQQNGISYLVLELLEGETLADRVRKGALPLDQVLKVGAEICDGLEKAHRSGVIHRDLKPSNVMLTKSGVKLMDFGLAKGPVAAVGASTSSDSLATMSRPLTAEGTIVGTFQYMSPEQVEGKEADARSDIFSLGAVLYEMVTGKRAFEGKTAASTMAAILASDPPPISTIQPMSPTALDKVVKSCLAKDPDDRLQTAHDLKLELRWLAEARAATPIARERTRRFWMAGTLTLLILAGLVMAAYFLRRQNPQAGTAKRVVIRLSSSAPLALARLAPLDFGRTSFALSPNGSQLVYVADLGDTSQLYVRPVDQFEAKPLSGTQGAYGPFVSPDGNWVGFFAENKLKKVSLLGGDPVVLCEARTPHGGSWGPDDTIVFSDEEGDKLIQVSANGLQVRAVRVSGNDASSPGSRELRFYYPQILWDGKWVLVSIPVSANWDFARIAAISLKTGELEFLVDGGTNPRYVPTGHLLFTRGKTLMAVPFDLVHRKVTGGAVAVVDGVKTEAWGAAQFAVSDEGTLIYLPGVAGWIGRLVIVDRRGAATPLPPPAQAYGVLKFSPHGERLAVEVGGATDDVWLYEFARGTFTRLTTAGSNSRPTWDPDGKRVTFKSFREGEFTIARRLADGSGTEERLITSKYSLNPGSWSPDGNVLAFQQSTASGNGELWTLPTNADRTPRPFLQTSWTAWGPGFSPDGHWIAYTADESGRSEVYVMPYPGPGGKWQVSSDGGEEPRWSQSGELFYRNGTKWMAVRVHTSPAFSAEKPQVMFEGNYINVMGIEYDVAPDGKHFVMIQANEPKSPSTELNAVFNWFADLTRQVPAAKE